MKIWLNGELVESAGGDFPRPEQGGIAAHNVSAHSVSALSAGLNLGWGVFTTLGVRDREPRFLARHLERLGRDAKAADVPLDFDFDFAAIKSALEAVLRANDIEQGFARLTLTRRGDGRWNRENGADFSIFVLSDLSPQNQENIPAIGLRAQLSPFRVEAKRALAGVKTTSYLSYLWAWREAKARGFDEAILRDGRDVWCEGARSSLFWMSDGELFTPSLETGCLRGIGRDLTFEWAARQRIPFQEGHFLWHDIQSASEMWLVSAATGPRPISALFNENSALQREFDAKTPFCAEFSRWFEAQSE